jgi:uncharacterized protein
MAGLGPDLRPPGVYPAYAEPVPLPLERADTRVAGFVGIAQRGPLGVPRRIASWDEFVEVYGYEGAHYLSDSVQSYFRNGGHACHVVRVAHVPPAGGARTAAHASCAELVAMDDWNKPGLRVRARSEGRWGNHIWVSFKRSSGASALLTQDLEVGAGAAQVSTTRGFRLGALVCIHDRENSDYVILTEVGERELRWAAATPINRPHRAAGPTYLEVMEFDLHASLRDRREVFKGLQMHPSSRRYAPRVVEQESRLIRLEDLGTSSPPPHNMPEPCPLTKLSDGRDGTDDITPEDFVGHDHGPHDRLGLLGLISVDEVAAVVCPDAMVFLDRNPGPEGELRTQRVQDSMVHLCEGLKDRFAILDCPRTRDVDAVKRWRQRTDSSYAAFYWPWVSVAAADGRTGPNQTMHSIPPSGIMAGIYARRDAEDGVHAAPGNVPLVDAIGVSVPVTEDDLGALGAEGVNVLRLGRGIRPWGVRTASSDPMWRYINVRRLFIMLRRSIESGMAWVTFEHNTDRTWDSVRDMVSGFLGDLHQRGMFAGGKPEDCYFVRCDAETNPADAVARGVLTCEIGVAPAIPAEFIVISVTQNTGGAE